MKMPYNWKCPACGSKTGTLSKTYPPTCSNPTKHSTKTVDMELVSTKSAKDEVE
jgi:hypothetical protein